MIKRVLTFMFAVLLSVVGGKAEGIPSSYFSEVALGEFYLYNVIISLALSYASMPLSV